MTGIPGTTPDDLEGGLIAMILAQGLVRPVLGISVERPELADEYMGLMP